MFLRGRRENDLEEKSSRRLARYQPKKYEEAEEVLRQTTQVQEKALGRRGLVLYQQKKYEEAEEVLRQAVQVRGMVPGQGHKDTLDSRYILGLTLYQQKKYEEAEEVLRQAVHGREKVLGQGHKDTLDSKYILGHTLYQQKKYEEAEEVLRQAVQGRVKVLGDEHEDTLRTKYILGHTLYQQKKFEEVEEVLQQLVQERVKVLGQGHKDTLDSNYWLGLTLHQQKKYGEAEEVLQQLVQEREKALGEEHEDTLRSKYRLGQTLHQQKKYEEAKEVLRHTVQVQEKVLGKEHGHTLDSRRAIQELTLAFSPPPLLNKSISTLNDHLSHFFATDTLSRAPYSDSQISSISELLKHMNTRWAKVPRTYIVLRMIDCLNHLDDFIDLGFSDHWFPIKERSLPQCLRPSLRTAFVNAQGLVLTKSMDLERGEDGQHCHFLRNDDIPFETKCVLGSGGFGQVDKVVSLISFREYARKRVPRRSVFGTRENQNVKSLVTEIEILKRLKHRHVVEFVGSYTDPKYVGLIMSPVAEMDLSTYLTRADTSRHRELRTFFGCLSRTLEFLHEQNVRHKDIKPGNVLVNHGHVLLTDFGLSFDFTNANGSTTLSMVNGLSQRYCAPEVAMLERRNTSSDIWSLGVVFLEMIVVLKGKTVRYIDEFFEQHGSQQVFVRTNPAAFPELVAELKGVGSKSDNRALEWVQQMLHAERESRPTAASLTLSIVNASREAEGSAGFCGICCSSRDEEDSDTDNETRS